MKRPCDLPEANRWRWLTPPIDAPLRRGRRWKQPKGPLTSQWGPCNPTLVRPKLRGYKADPQHMCLRILRYPESKKKKVGNPIHGRVEKNKQASRTSSGEKCASIDQQPMGQRSSHWHLCCRHTCVCQVSFRGAKTQKSNFLLRHSKTWQESKPQVGRAAHLPQRTKADIFFPGFTNVGFV